MSLNKQHLFIIGSPRSGTTWLQIMIDAHPLVCTTVELTLFSKYTGPWIKAWKDEAYHIDQGHWYQGLPFLWNGGEFYAFLREFLDKVYERVVATNPQATHILDKHPGYSSYVEDINALLPKARFIHIIRDGRDVAVSMIAARKNIGFGPDDISDAASSWKTEVVAAQQARQFENRYFEVRYEDLLTAGVDTMRSIFNFCGLSLSMVDVATIVEQHSFENMKANRLSAVKGIKTSEAHYRKGEMGNWRKELTPMDKYLFDQIAGDLLCQLGYAENGWWAESHIQRIILPLRASIAKHIRMLK